MAICSLSEMIVRLFELTGLEQVFEVHPTVRGALRGASG
jgi:anti-anti-sigma regulatory factor